jgi:alkanesulfonate monooxygenase SsuD/methylene tetrahydromethanopterin reductase-like flavin-dependent oxidoreductase (luciferase family)
MRFGVGLWCLQATASAPRHHVRAYRELREDAQLIEELGFDSAWLSEHHFFYDGYCPALLPAAATVLAVTRRLRVGTGMLLLPLQDPARLAVATRTLSDRSGRRLDLGVGLGYRDVEFDGKGVARAERIARLSAGLDLLEEAVPDVPVWIGSATPRGLARAGARGHGVLLSAANPLPLVRRLAAAHRQAWEDAGRPRGRRPRLAALRNVWVTDDDAERRAVLDWVRASYVLYAGLGWSVASQGEVAAMDFRRDVDRAVADAVGTTIIGPAPVVAQGLREVMDAGVDDVVFRLVIEGVHRGALHRVLQRLSREVMPQLSHPEAVHE